MPRKRPPARPGPSPPPRCGSGVRGCRRHRRLRSHAGRGHCRGHERRQGNVWTAGDNVYPEGTTLSNWTNCYEPSWGGAIKARTRPTPGNHDWGTNQPGPDELDAYFTYFGAAATDADGKSYYSYDIADSNWHIVNLDSECQLVPGGCDEGSPQELWLRADLAANSTENVIAVWHKPRFSSGVTNYAALQPLYEALYDFGVDILLVGHDHIYERLAP